MAALLESRDCSERRQNVTGADRDRVGVFESANRGTVFLDEIGDIDAAFQVKLLRFLQEREIRPVGAAREKKVDVRVVVATNRNLQKMVEEGKFREDLWFRLGIGQPGCPRCASAATTCRCSRTSSSASTTRATTAT